MDVLSLFSGARAAGLTVRADGDRLVVSGPPSAGEIARRIGQHKADVLAFLNGECCRIAPGRLRPTVHGHRLFCPVCERRRGADAPYPWSGKP